jgi:hypothetical protein
MKECIRLPMWLQNRRGMPLPALRLNLKRLRIGQNFVKWYSSTSGRLETVDGGGGVKCVAQGGDADDTAMSGQKDALAQALSTVWSVAVL